MAIPIEKITTEYGTYYRIDSDSVTDVLNTSQMESNVTVMRNIIADLYPGWTTAAIAALAGNAQSEGALNPNQWQYGLGKSLEGGYGLWQWTPATKFLNWCKDNGYWDNDIYHQVLRLEYERSTKIQYYPTSKYNFSFTQFLEGDYSVDTLARAWLYNYERPANPEASENTRVERSKRWFDFLGGEEPKPPHPAPGGGNNTFKFYMYPGWRSQGGNKCQ